MTTIHDQKVEEVRTKIENGELKTNAELAGIVDATEIAGLERLNYRLSDAIREGSTVAPQAKGWGDGETMCAMHAAVVAAEARGFM